MHCSTVNQICRIYLSQEYFCFSLQPRRQTYLLPTEWGAARPKSLGAIVSAQNEKRHAADGAPHQHASPQDAPAPKGERTQPIRPKTEAGLPQPGPRRLHQLLLHVHHGAFFSSRGKYILYCKLF